MTDTPLGAAACSHTAHRVNDQGRQGQINGTAWEPCEPGSAAPLLIVHPEDVDLPWVKAEAASRGVDVVGSARVPRGSAFLAAGEVRNATHF